MKAEIKQFCIQLLPFARIVAVSLSLSIIPPLAPTINISRVHPQLLQITDFSITICFCPHALVLFFSFFIVLCNFSTICRSLLLLVPPLHSSVFGWGICIINCQKCHKKGIYLYILLYIHSVRSLFLPSQTQQGKGFFLWEDIDIQLVLRNFISLHIRQLLLFFGGLLPVRCSWLKSAGAAPILLYSVRKGIPNDIPPEIVCLESWQRSRVMQLAERQSLRMEAALRTLRLTANLLV